MFAHVKKNQYDTKKKTFGYKEQNQEKRQAYLTLLEHYAGRRLVYLDEAGIDENESYPYGWSTKGQRCYAQRSGKRPKRVNFIAGLANKKLMSPFVFEGYCDTRIFETYIEQCLTPELLPKDVVILDNASFHKSGRIKTLIEACQAELLYLPPYSPDFNPIEHYWFSVKNQIRKNLDTGNQLHDAIDNALLFFV